MRCCFNYRRTSKPIPDCWTAFSPLSRAPSLALSSSAESWLADATYDVLARYNAALCVAEDENRATPDIVTAPFCYYRYRLPTYTPQQRRAMIERMREHLSAGRDTYSGFQHEETPQGALYAVEVLRELAQDSTGDRGAEDSPQFGHR